MIFSDFVWVTQSAKEQWIYTIYQVLDSISIEIFANYVNQDLEIAVIEIPICHMLNFVCQSVSEWYLN